MRENNTELVHIFLLPESKEELLECMGSVSNTKRTDST